MDLYAFIKDAALALATDDALQSWAQTTYQAPVKIFISEDDRDPPGEGDMPYVTLFPLSRRAGRGQSRKQYRVVAACRLLDESRVTHASELIIEWQGTARLERMRRLVLAVIAGMDTDDALLDAEECEYDTISFFPIFECAQVLSFVEDVEIGGDYLDLE